MQMIHSVLSGCQIYRLPIRSVRRFSSPRKTRRKYRRSSSRQNEEFFMKKYMNTENPELVDSALNYIRRLIVATGFEKHEVVCRERQLRESLSTKELELRGLALRDLELDCEHFVPCCKGGEVEVRLKKETSFSGRFTWRSGTLVTLQYSRDNQFEYLEPWQEVFGIISDITSFTITLRLNYLTPFLAEGLTHGRLEGFVRVVKRSEENIYRNQSSSLKSILENKLEVDPAKPIGQIYGALFSDVEKENVQTETEHTLKIYDKRIQEDESKVNALKVCSECYPVTLIHGPPGTGKTTTLAAAVLSAVANGEKVLVAAPSHAACDAFTLALSSQWPRHFERSFVRLGNTLRFTNPAVNKFSTESFHPSSPLDDIEHELAFLRRQLLDQVKGKSYIIKEESKLIRDHKRLTNSMENDIISDCSVVITTIMHSARLKRSLQEGLFDLIVIDEAGFTPASNVLPLMTWAPRLILAGDHLQLPPVVLTQEAKHLGLEKSIFELLAGIKKQNVCLLETQFRSNEQIMGWSNEYFYENRLKSSSNVKDILMSDLLESPNDQKFRRKHSFLLESPVLFVDTRGLGWNEDLEDEDSASNCDEAVFVAELVEKLTSLGIQESDIGVISPYWAQIFLIRSLLWEGSGMKNVEVRTIDGFQGREKEIIIISFVRSNEHSEVGYLSETRRINVSITRAKRACLIVGDSQTLNADAGVKSLIDYCDHLGAKYSVKDFYELTDVI